MLCLFVFHHSIDTEQTWLEAYGNTTALFCIATCHTKKQRDCTGHGERGKFMEYLLIYNRKRKGVPSILSKIVGPPPPLIFKPKSRSWEVCLPQGLDLQTLN